MQLHTNRLPRSGSLFSFFGEDWWVEEDAEAEQGSSPGPEMPLKGDKIRYKIYLTSVNCALYSEFVSRALADFHMERILQDAQSNAFDQEAQLNKEWITLSRRPYREIVDRK
jgi:hypothetical protein